MQILDEEIIEKLYSSSFVTDIETTPEYKKLLKEYNTLFDSIESEELKNKLAKLEEIKNKLYNENDRQIFKTGFSIATKIIIEALTLKL